MSKVVVKLKRRAMAMVLILSHGIEFVTSKWMA